MNPLKKNFERNKKMKQEFGIKACLKELDNQHLTWCEKINEEQDFKFEHLLNGTLFEKIQTLKQVKFNEKSEILKEYLVIQLVCDPLDVS